MLGVHLIFVIEKLQPVATMVQLTNRISCEGEASCVVKQRMERINNCLKEKIEGAGAGNGNKTELYITNTNIKKFY